MCALAAPSSDPLPQLCLYLPGASPDPASPVHCATMPIQDDDNTHGLDDVDIMISRETAVMCPHGHQNLVHHCTSIPYLACLIITQALQVVYTEPELPKKPKGKRTVQADIDPKASCAGKNVPVWISKDFNSIILPTISNIMAVRTIRGCSTKRSRPRATQWLHPHQTVHQTATRVLSTSSNN